MNNLSINLPLIRIIDSTCVEENIYTNNMEIELINEQYLITVCYALKKKDKLKTDIFIYQEQLPFQIHLQMALPQVQMLIQEPIQILLMVEFQLLVRLNFLLQVILINIYIFFKSLSFWQCFVNDHKADVIKTEHNK